MVTLTYKENQIPVQEGQSVLEVLLEQGHVISYGCKQGICQSCLLRATEGEVPLGAQIGLKGTQKAQHYFLSCLCKPSEDLVVVDVDNLNQARAQIVSIKELSPSIYGVSLKIQGDFIYKAGQYINLSRSSDRLIRSYSIASVQELSPDTIELHIKVFQGGEMSNWLCADSPLSEISVIGPMGTCFYIPDFQAKNIILLGYGTGLAPLYGILQDALFQGHKGSIHLYHWASAAEDLYYQTEILALIKGHPNVFYQAGLEDLETGDEAEKREFSAPKILSGDPCVLIKEAFPSLKDWKIFLCGSETKVNKARRIFYLAGADLSDIYADAFFTWQTPKPLEREGTV